MYIYLYIYNIHVYIYNYSWNENEESRRSEPCKVGNKQLGFRRSWEKGENDGLVGGIPTPLKNMRQLGLRNSQLMEK